MSEYLLQLPTNNVQGLSTVCLALCPLYFETSQDADEHISFMEFIFGVFGKDLDNYVVLIGDHCSTSRSTAKNIKRPLIGCSSHRIYLSISEVIWESTDVVEEVHKLIAKL